MFVCKMGFPFRKIQNFFFFRSQLSNAIYMSNELLTKIIPSDLNCIMPGLLSNC